VRMECMCVWSVYWICVSVYGIYMNEVSMCVCVGCV